MKNTNQSGWHLMIDAIVTDSSFISDETLLKQMLLDLVKLLNMEILSGPTMAKVELDPVHLETDHDEGGITGYCLITTSHLSIHTWPLRNRFCMDIFSCQEFDGEAATLLVKECLRVESANVQWFERSWPTPSISPPLNTPTSNSPASNSPA